MIGLELLDDARLFTLDGRTQLVRVGTENAATTLRWGQVRTARRAVIRNQSVVRQHDFGVDDTAFRAGQVRFQNYFKH